MENRKINEIANEIKSDWKKVNYFSRPYLNVMLYIDSIDEDYKNDGENGLYRIPYLLGHNDAKSIVTNFLVSANDWHGENARRIKKELKEMI
jgi:hypothetical protein|tara:strand:- start:763 stop:1038 length:276 start_codon:yes stop_codon:yes gene_type:complete